MSRFMLLFRGDPDARLSLSPEEMQQAMRKWMSWMESLEKGGHAPTAGDRLDSRGTVVRGRAKTVADGPYVEVKDAVQGFMLLEAGDMEQAVELSKGCPALEMDGSVEVRPIFSM